jgi:hypothetical protein
MKTAGMAYTDISVLNIITFTVVSSLLIQASCNQPEDVLHSQMCG